MRGEFLSTILMFCFCARNRREVDSGGGDPPEED